MGKYLYHLKKYDSVSKLYTYYAANNDGFETEFLITPEYIKAKDWYIIMGDD